MGGEAPERDSRGLRGGWARFQQHRYATPAPDLAPFVGHYWFVSWDLRGEPPYRQLVAPNPIVQLSFPPGAVPAVHGVSRTHGFKTLSDAGRVFGIAFRPGCFRPFLGRSVATISGRSVPAREVFGAGVPAQAMAEAAGCEEMLGIAEDFLRARLPDRDPVAEWVADVVDRVAAEPDVARVDVLAERAGTSVRRLQRLFAEYVGVGPKWVIRRYRLREVTERLAAGTAVDWARLAAELGYTDQAHFSRDFTAILGEPPSRYAERYPRVG